MITLSRKAVLKLVAFAQSQDELLDNNHAIVEAREALAIHHLDGLYNLPFPGRLDFVEARINECEAELHALRIEAERLDPEYDGAGEGRRNWLVFKVGKAMIHLRDAEDFARFKMPAWPTADRIRVIHQRLTDDVLNGSTSRPTPEEALAALRGEPWESPRRRRRGR